MTCFRVVMGGWPEGVELSEESLAYLKPSEMGTMVTKWQRNASDHRCAPPIGL